MNDTLRMDDYRNALHFDVKKPASFDHFESLIEERCRVDGDFPAHDPGRMFQSAFDGDAGKFFFWRGTEGAARSGEPEFAHGAGRFAIETLENGRVFAVDGKDADIVFAGLAHNDFACHDEDFF